MHEMALMGDILQLVEKDIKEREISYVKKITLIVGELSNALPDALEMAFDVYKGQGLFFLNEESLLEIRKEEAIAECVICNQQYRPDQRIAVCPSCGVPSGKLIQGETFVVHSYESEE